MIQIIGPLLELDFVALIEELDKDIENAMGRNSFYAQFNKTDSINMRISRL
jgi:hypothetical protein